MPSHKYFHQNQKYYHRHFQEIQRITELKLHIKEIKRKHLKIV